MNQYEGIIIFPEDYKDEVLDEALGRVKEEVKSLGGQMEGAARLGRRSFARPMQKKMAGNYVVVNIQLPGEQLVNLHARFKLNEDVFRAQFIRQDAAAVSAEA